MWLRIKMLNAMIGASLSKGAKEARIVRCQPNARVCEIR